MSRVEFTEEKDFNRRIVYRSSDNSSTASRWLIKIGVVKDKTGVVVLYSLVILFCIFLIFFVIKSGPSNSNSLSIQEQIQDIQEDEFLPDSFKSHLIDTLRENQ